MTAINANFIYVDLEVEQLADHGITLPPNMQGLTDEQIEELKLHDDWADKCKPSGGPVFNQDKIGRRNGEGIYLYNFIPGISHRGYLS